MLIGKGNFEGFLTDPDIRALVAEALCSLDLDGKRVLVLIPDGTRTMPMPLMFSAIEQTLRGRTKALDYMVALGTHPPMSDAQLTNLVGQPVHDGRTGQANIYNHRWERPDTFTTLGTISADEISKITSGLMKREVVVSLNKAVLEYDHLIICGPVFPHEVVGFSGGNKYFFPGIGGPEIINFTHWLGALITNHEVIGAGYTPVRAVIDRAAQLIPRSTSCFALVVKKEGVAGLFFGAPEVAWRAAAELSSSRHIHWVEKPFRRVLSILPKLYDDLWTGAKGMYKLEPAIADGGEVIIYAPHITEVSYSHGKFIDEIGYHCRDYFTKQWDRFQHYPGGVLAHSTHLKGLGTYDPDTKKETGRIKVTLATGISPDRCRRINLNYLNPAEIDLEAWQTSKSEENVVIPRAGEILYRVKRSQDR